MRASEESPERRHKRWCELRGHLRAGGLNEKPDDTLLLDAERTTRPDVRLVAYFDEIKQESTGKKTSTEILTAVLAVVLGVRALTGFDLWFDDTEQWVPGFGWWILTLAMLTFTYTVVGWFLRKMKSREDSLCLTREELSLSLPDGNRHVPWRDVYSVSVIRRRKWLGRRKPYVRRAVEPCIRVELNDGVVARLYVDEIDRQPLADLMRDFVVHHRGNHAVAPEAAS